MTLKQATDALMSGICVMACGHRVCMRHDEIWIGGELVMSTVDFIEQYSDCDFHDIEPIDSWTAVSNNSRRAAS